MPKKKKDSELQELPSSKDIDRVYGIIKEILEQARDRAIVAVNHEKTLAYWNIGRVIVEEEQEGKKRAEYGSALIKEVSARMTHEFGRGYDKRNLFYMKAFYLCYPKVNALRSQLSWTHYRILTKIDNSNKRAFYMQEAIDRRWGYRELERQIALALYERHQIGESTGQEVTSDIQEPFETKDYIKDPLFLHFLGLEGKQVVPESTIEQAIIDNLQQFLLELGKGFCFVGRQYKISIDGDNYRVDLVFFNYLLNCFVLIDLKAKKITPRDVGQMDFYVEYFNQEVRKDFHNPTIGLILGTDKGKGVVRYTQLAKNEHLFASQYKLYLPSEEELKQYISEEKERLEMEKRLDEE